MHVPYAVVPLAVRDHADRRRGDARHHERAGRRSSCSCSRLLLIRGTQESAFVNGLIVVTKVSIVLLVIVHRLGFINPANHTPFIPEPTHLRRPAGRRRTPTAASWASWAPPASCSSPFIGFDAVSTAAQEAKNPKRDMPIGILGSLVVCTILYVLFSYVLSGLAPVEDFRTRRQAKPRWRLRDHEVHDRLRLAVEVRDGRDPGRVLVGHPGHAARPVARLLLDEPRRPGAGRLLRGPPEVPHAVQVEHGCSSCSRRCSRRSSRATSSAR